MGLEFSPNNSIFASAAGASEEIKKILKKEEKKGGKKVAEAIKNYHLAHAEVKKELAAALSAETGKSIKPSSPLVDSAVFSISLGRIFENTDGETNLHPDLKQALQHYDSESEEAKHAVAHHLSRGSKQEVPSGDDLIRKDIDEISIRTLDNPGILYS
ncbi:hypothetical protein HP1_085 [Candidatus Termititenax spirochaetophilus]|uniref:Uncharacterized protein n=1 Tax=Candidatus Termititenax spirochaetophilus TaxID=2218522 RepID=A0A388T8P7_9BACT|nr:hypothetical protein HP1_085 [Candidatus Termititenax spirochaetophilus]